MDNMMIPPHSSEAEQAVIGAVMINPSCWDDVSFLSPADFYRADHRAIWSRFSNPDMRDFVAMSTVMDSESISLLGEIAKNTPGSANAARYASIVRDRALLRRFIAECNQSISEAFKSDVSPLNLIADHVRKSDDLLSCTTNTSGLRHVFDITIDWYNNAKKRSSEGRVSGIGTGFHFLDRRWGGLRDSTVTIIAGRPKTGKTTLALNIAEYVSRSMPVALFQMEMGEDEMADRLIASVARYELDEIRGGNIPDDCDPLVQASNMLKLSKLHIDTTPRQTIDYIRVSAKRFAREHGKPVIFIDYLGLVEMSARSSKNEAVSEVSREIKLLAKELRCPVVLLCQMNRNAEREKRRPQLSDLRDSGSIEQDADVICFTHKEDEEQEYSEIITRAIRSGKPGTDYLMCQFGVGRFETPHESWAPPEKTVGGKRQKKTDGW